MANAGFAWEMARTYATENYKAYEFYYRSWVELAEELKYTDLAYALRSCKPCSTIKPLGISARL